MKKIAVFFPGLGYSTERPLLYYTKKMLKSYGYELLELDYANLISEDITKNIRDNLMNPKTVKSAVLKYVTEAVKLTERQLENAGLNFQLKEYNKTIMISKSIGSVVDMVFSQKHEMSAEHILFTPLEQAFQFNDGASGIAFFGEADPVVSADVIRGICAEQGIQFCEVPAGNHSLETGIVDTDIKNLSWIMNDVNSYVTGFEKSVYD